jgi:hypothetical protein
MRQLGRGRRKREAHTPRPTIHKLHPPPMTTNKPWGKADKAALTQLIIDGYVNIEDVSLPYIDYGHGEFFCHHELHNFRQELPHFLSGI